MSDKENESGRRSLFGELVDRIKTSGVRLVHERHAEEAANTLVRVKFVDDFDHGMRFISELKDDPEEEDLDKRAVRVLARVGLLALCVHDDEDTT